eukprot:15461185-Alexandrium_andersonii.AAC.1
MHRASHVRGQLSEAQVAQTSKPRGSRPRHHEAPEPHGTRPVWPGDKGEGGRWREWRRAGRRGTRATKKAHG